jgi:hypothetical protein
MKKYTLSIFLKFSTNLGQKIAHNVPAVYASGAVAPSGYEKRSRRFAPLCIFSPPHFCKPWKPTVSFIGYRACKNVLNSRNDIRQKQRKNRFFAE